MSTKAFKCWMWDRGETAVDARLLDRMLREWEPRPYDEQGAAEKYAAQVFADYDYPKEMEIAVAEVLPNGDDGPVFVFDVEVRAEPAFYATKRMVIPSLITSEPTP